MSEKRTTAAQRLEGRFWIAVAAAVALACIAMGWLQKMGVF